MIFAHSYVSWDGFFILLLLLLLMLTAHSLCNAAKFMMFIFEKSLEIWYYFVSKQKRKTSIEQDIFIIIAYLYWLFPQQMFCNQKLIYLQSCHPIIFFVESHNNNVEYLKWREIFFNNNLMTLCVWKCIYSTWHTLFCHFFFAKTHSRIRLPFQFHSSLRRKQIHLLSPSPLFIFLRCINKVKPQQNENFHDANGELLQHLLHFGLPVGCLNT